MPDRKSNQINNLATGKNLASVPQLMRQSYIAEEQKEMVEFLQKDPLKDLKVRFYAFKKYPTPHGYNIIKSELKKYRKLGDISSYEDELPSLQREAYLNNLNQSFGNIKNNPTLESYSILLSALQEARKLGIDVSDYETQLPDLQIETQQSKS